MRGPTLLFTIALTFSLLTQLACAQTSQDDQSSISSENKTSQKIEPVYLICKNKKMVRTLRVLKKSNGGCSATYTKEGVDQTVGNSWAVERCSRIIINIKDNLEKAAWKCKDISEARVSSSESL